MNTGIRDLDKEKVVAVLHALFPKAKIHLFGSRAAGHATHGSDVDLALDAGEKIDFVALDEAKRVLKELNVIQSYDLVDYHDVRQEIRDSIDKQKVLWFDPNQK